MVADSEWCSWSRVCNIAAVFNFFFCNINVDDLDVISLSVMIYESDITHFLGKK